jgi:hypothetical protein
LVEGTLQRLRRVSEAIRVVAAATGAGVATAAGAAMEADIIEGD